MLLLYVVLTLVFVFVWPLFVSVDCEYEYDCGECFATCGKAAKECIIHITQEAKHGEWSAPVTFVKDIFINLSVISLISH